MQRVVILILILAVAGGVYYLISSDDSGPNDGDLTADGNPGVGKKGGDAGLNPKAKKGELPLPDPVMRQLQSPARALLIGKHKEGWNHTILMVCAAMRDLTFRSWFLQDASGDGGGSAGPGSRGTKPLEGKPTADDLTDEDVTVLILDNIDPNALPTEFWNVVSARVTSGRMGLYVRPGFPGGNDGRGLSEHPMLSHPVLKELLPVKSAALLSGTPVPGIFAEPQTLSVTSDGTRHPATRLVAVPEGSVKAWGAATSGPGALGCKFCYPVTEVKAEWQQLVNCDAATPLPAVIATLPTAKMRVLWQGNVDFGHKTHYVRGKDAIQKIFINHAILWLAGQAR